MHHEGGGVREAGSREEKGGAEGCWEEREEMEEVHGFGRDLVASGRYAGDLVTAMTRDGEFFVPHASLYPTPTFSPWEFPPIISRSQQSYSYSLSPEN